MRYRYGAWLGCVALFVAAQACGDDDETPPGTTTTPTGSGGTTSTGNGGTGGDTGGNTSTGGTGGSTSTGGGGAGGGSGLATVSGTARRNANLTPAGDGVGTLCLSLRTTCSDAGTEGASASVADADLSDHNNTVDFSITDVEDGAWVLMGWLDDDASGCDDPNTGDMVPGQCMAADVTGGADVTGLNLILQGLEQ